MLLPARALCKFQTFDFKPPNFSAVAQHIKPVGLGPMADKLRAGGFRFSYSGVRSSVGRKHFLSQSHANVMNAFITDMLRNNIIAPAPRGPFLSYPFLIPKANGTPRMIVDYSHLTPFLRKISISLPLFSDILRSHPVPRGLMAVRLDLSHAFYSIPVHHRSRFLTTFMLAGRRYMFNRLPMGLSPSPSLLQSVLLEAFKPIRDLFSLFWVHVDDVLVAAPPHVLHAHLGGT